MTPTYDVMPGQGVGLFQLGDNLWHVLEIVRTHKAEFPKVEVSWDKEAPHKSAVTIHLPHLTLYFPPSPLYQLLSLISVTSLQASGTGYGASPDTKYDTSNPASYSTSYPKSSLTLTYETQILYSPTQPLTRARVGRLMGPTFISGGGDKLDFPGIKFQLSTGVTGSGGLGPREDFVSSIVITPRPDEELVPKLTSCVVQPGIGVTLAIDGEDILPIVIGETTSQDLSLDLGPPLRKFWKEDDRLERMWGGHNQPGACFWNYFQHGLDFLVSSDGVVSKILCHSNIPGTPLFQRYARCPWLLPISSSPNSESLNLTSSASAFRSHLTSSETAEQFVGEIRLTVPVSSPSPSPSPDPTPGHSASGSGELGNANGGGGGGGGGGNGGKKGKKKRNGASPSATPDTAEAQDKEKDTDREKEKEKVSQQLEKSERKGADTSKGAGTKDGNGDAMMLDRLVEGGFDGVTGLGPSRLIGFDGLIIEEDEKSGGICSILIYADGVGQGEAKV